MHGLVEDVEGHAEQQEAVDDRGQDLEAVGAVRAPARCGPLREADRGEGQAEAQDIGAHVCGVADQGQGAGDDAGHDLHQGVRRGDGEGDGQRLLVALAGAADPRAVGVPVTTAVPG